MPPSPTASSTVKDRYVSLPMVSPTMGKDMPRQDFRRWSILCPKTFELFEAKSGISETNMRSTGQVLILLAGSTSLLVDAFTRGPPFFFKMDGLAPSHNALQTNRPSLSLAQQMHVAKRRMPSPTRCNHHDPSVVMESASSGGVLAFLVQSSEFWSVSIMLSIIMLLYAWEETVKSAREKLPSTLMPVVDSMLAEMGGLGFIGLFLSVFVTDGIFGSFLAEISEQFLGDEEILIETFEFLHTAFFEVGIGFFVISGLTVFKVLRKIESLSEISRVVFDVDKDGKVCLEDLATVLEVETVDVDLDNDGIVSDEEISQLLKETPVTSFWEEVFMSAMRIKAEALVVRERFIQQKRAPPSLRIENYFEDVFGNNLREMVELSPLVWLPLVPSISLGRNIDMSKDIISASSPNASLSSGCFLNSPEFFLTCTSFFVLSVFWGVWNFWKMASIKEMLVPTVVRDLDRGGTACLLPPRYELDELIESFDSSPPIVATIESFFAAPPRNRQERLFGVVGSAGPELYRNSIKLHTWLVVSQIVFWGGQIVARDAEALISGADVGVPSLIVPQILIYGFYVLVAFGQLALFPQTFLNFSLVTSIENLTEEAALLEAAGEEATKLEVTMP